ncbi:MAG: metal-binding protein [Anaerolineales bacterium]|nr:metal-binding protein [Anaerolineales bacterium]
MWRHAELSDAELFALLRSGAICYAGNRRLKIYGRLDCGSGRRMKRENRVFFVDAAEAMAAGYRPCGHCMREKARDVGFAG